MAFWKQRQPLQHGRARCTVAAAQGAPGQGPKQSPGNAFAPAGSGWAASSIRPGGIKPPFDLQESPPGEDGGSGNQSSVEHVTSLIDLAAARRMGVSEDMVEALARLPGSEFADEVTSRVKALGQWRSALQKGALPDLEQVTWPGEPLGSTISSTLSDLEMPRFCRRFPTLLNTVVNQMLELIGQFEQEKQEMDQEDGETEEEQQQEEQEDGEDGQAQDTGEPGDEPGEEEQPQGGSAPSQQGDGEGQEGDGQQGSQQDPGLQLSMESSETSPQQKQDQQLSPEEQEKMEEQERKKQAREQALRDKAKQMMEEFKQEWEPVMSNLDAAVKAFDDLEGLMDPKGYDLSQGIWQESGWKEVEDLRKKLEKLPELRELVRKLGRSGGKGPKRRAPEEVQASHPRPGVIRSPLQPEETRGLARSGDISRMLPFEAHLMAAGSQRRADKLNDGVLTSSGKTARRLFRVRRAEKNLMSYERTGWLEDEPSRMTGRFEIKPAAEMGPIIVCLDTSGSMIGPRETVAKAAALECMRSAQRTGRKCYLYAFSGPQQVQEMELAVRPEAMRDLLQFLQYSFGGGTDVDRPLELSLQRLEDQSWNQADILMVTDGEICMPSDYILSRLDRAREDMGLEVHGLLVGTPYGGEAVMEKLCSHLHYFQSWTAVGGKAAGYY
eukprot:CAMPEP_0206142050 /NCGR_PEP_ID=MMETSP1473-20131121/15266_1 /ASSEMBLY_ACC=CAM_ASM_001109 /TAXON_ID=1461547 /ORGANISM="Stichococcus sp, Strain RCC1054" /LENGTH=666 /DNA_ID=CAMNT_0053536869 /DNA_START=327 /DNA_END=2327 /DNA_ORIENTATION=-